MVIHMHAYLGRKMCYVANTCHTKNFCGQYFGQYNAVWSIFGWYLVNSLWSISFTILQCDYCYPDDDLVTLLLAAFTRKLKKIWGWRWDEMRWDEMRWWWGWGWLTTFKWWLTTFCIILTTYLTAYNFCIMLTTHV